MPESLTADRTAFVTIQVCEMISWRLAAEFHRRHPNEWTLIETHPGGGIYDCLTFYSERSSACLNRQGSFQGFSGDGDDRIDSEDLWKRCLAVEDFTHILNQISQSSRSPVPKRLPSTSRESLSYRVMAFVVSAFVLDRERWEWRNAKEDTAGWGDQKFRDAWMNPFSAAKTQARERRESDPFGCPLYRFWFLLRNGDPVLCLSKDALCWSLRGDEVDLFPIYRASRSLAAVGSRTFGLLPA